MVDGGDQDSSGRPLVGYAVAGVAVLIGLVAAIAVLAGGDEGGDPVGSGRADGAPKDVLPEGGLFAIPEEATSVRAAAKAAGCELRTYKASTRDHVSELDQKVRYSSSPPTSGRHYPVPAADGAYEKSPDVKMLVHTLEHSRVIIWFDRALPEKARASLKAYYDHDSRQLVLVPDTTGMTYAVAATAWHRSPKPYGSGRLLGCPEHGDAVYTALEIFKDSNRGRGPEPIP